MGLRLRSNKKEPLEGEMGCWTAETKLMSSELGTFLAYAQRGLSRASLYTNSYIPGQSYTPFMCTEPTDPDRHRHFPEWASQFLFGHLAAVSHDLILLRLFSVPHPNNHYGASAQPQPFPSPNPNPESSPLLFS